MVLTSAQREIKKSIKEYFEKYHNKAIALKDLSMEFKQAHLVTILNEMLAEGYIIQMRGTFRLPHKEGE